MHGLQRYLNVLEQGYTSAFQAVKVPMEDVVDLTNPEQY